VDSGRALIFSALQFVFLFVIFAFFVVKTVYPNDGGFLVRATAIFMLALGFSAGMLSGCSKPIHTPSLVGANMFHDINQVRVGMGNNEVLRVMGGRYKTVYEEGIRGIDGGNYIWEYAEGRIYFGLNGVTKVLPFEK
jgi:hypothetical protein